MNSAKGQVSSVTKLNLSKNSQLFDVNTGIAFQYSHEAHSIESEHLDVKRMPEVMTKFFSTTFGNVTQLIVSHCNLTSSAAEVKIISLVYTCTQFYYLCN